MNLKETKSLVFTNYGAGVFVSIILLLVGVTFFANQENGVIDATLTESDLNYPLTISGPVLASSTPTLLRIPKLNIESKFVEPLGLDSVGAVGVPDSYEEVGWYKYSPTPGALGPAVILGHVDSSTGPAVFFYLGQLEPGDDIFVDREDGTTAHFKVESLERPRQAEFPTARVYGNIDHAGLRLITCSGLYVKGKQRYTHNLVVYARLVS